jgi:hypothetical protein
MERSVMASMGMNCRMDCPWRQMGIFIKTRQRGSTCTDGVLGARRLGSRCQAPQLSLLHRHCYGDVVTTIAFHYYTPLVALPLARCETREGGK